MAAGEVVATAPPLMRPAAGARGAQAWIFATCFTNPTSLCASPQSTALTAATLHTCASHLSGPASIMPRIIPLLLLASAAALYSRSVCAESCHGPTAPAHLPEPATATAEDILAAQQSVKQYLTDMELALKCFDASHDTNAHNSAIDDMQKTALKFNTVLRAFKARQKA